MDTPQTQVLPDRAGHLGEAGSDIGQRLGPDKLELFVATDAAQAVQEQIAHHRPEYIALHDLGGSSGLRLLAAIGAARGTPLQQLVIRRQGHGVALATLRFVELESRDGRRLRLYSTDVDADSQARRQLARVLMGHARLAVMMVAELPAHALDSALAPWREALQTGPWTNREIIMLPLSTAMRLGEHAARLVGQGQVNVAVSAAAVRPNEVWAVVAGAWNRMRSASRRAAATGAAVPGEGAAGSKTATPCANATADATVLSFENAAVAPQARAEPLIERLMSLAAVGHGAGLAHAPAAGESSGDSRPEAPRVLPQAAAAEAPEQPTDNRPRAMAPMPAGPALASIPSAGAPQRALYERYLRACEQIKGLMSACIFEVRGGQCLAHVGGRPDPAPLTAQGMRLYTTLAESGHALGLGGSQPDATIALTQHLLLLHPLPGHPGIAMHAVLDGSIADPTQARTQLRRVDASVLAASSARPRVCAS